MAIEWQVLYGGHVRFVISFHLLWAFFITRVKFAAFCSFLLFCCDLFDVDNGICEWFISYTKGLASV